MSPHLLALPEELQIKILSCLSGASLMLCALTCKSIHNTIKVSSQLAYITQLHLDGLKYVESTMENHDYPGLIKNLHRDRRAWTTLDWMNVPKLSFTQESCGTFDIGTNGFVSLANNKFTIIPLSNPDTGIVNRSRIKGRLPDTISARGLIVDLSQDLIIILENVSIISPDLTLIKFHLRSMSGNDKHPLAKQSPLEIKVHEKGTTENGVYILNNMHIVTMNDILAVQFHHAFSMHEVIPRSRYLMWNWVTSELVFDSSLHSFDLPPSPRERLGFTLLEPTLFLMTTLQDSGSIRLYRLTETGLLLHLATFHLPATIPTAKICNVSSVTVANEVHPPTSKPYIVDIDERIHDFRIKYRHADNLASYVTLHMFVKQRTFSRYGILQSTSSVPHEIQWDDWGPTNTRIISPRRMDRGSGSSFITCQRAVFRSRNAPRSPMMILDFSPAAVSSFEKILESKSGSDILVTLLPPTGIFTTEFPIFHTDLFTHLPCVQLTKGLGRGYAEFLMHAEGVLGINPYGDDGISVDVFHLDD